MNEPHGAPTLHAMGGIPHTNSVLYVGACEHTFAEGFVGYWILDQLPHAKFTVLEAFGPLIPHLKANEYVVDRDIEVVHGDVRHVDSVLAGRRFDATIWWHGPEHIERELLESTLGCLEQMTRRYMILGCPMGESPQAPFCDAGELNPYEEHLTAIQPSDLAALGYSVLVIPRREQEPGMSAWKVLTSRHSKRIMKGTNAPIAR